jgi:multidrug resistance efflux pump
MSKLLKRLVPVLIIGLAIGTFVYMKNSKPQQPPVQVSEKVWSVDALTVQLQSISAVQTLYGEVESNALVQAASPISAVVEKVAVLPGDEIKKGQLLVALSNQDVSILLQQAQADVADARAQLQLQKLTIEANHQRLEHEQKVLGLKQEALQRAKSLLKKNLASQSAVDTAKEALVRQEYVVVGADLAVKQSDAQLSQLQARLQKALTALEQAKLNQQRAVVKAPFAGRISSVGVSVGDRVNTGAVMVSFYSLDSLELKAKLPANSLPQAQQALDNGQPLQAYIDSDNAQRVSMPMKRLAGQATTSGVDAYFAVPNELHQKRPGELMEIYLQGRVQSKVAAVPYSAVYGNNRIYVIEDQRLQSRQVSLQGEVMHNGKLQALVSAPQLQNGMKVLVTHLPNAINGLKVAEVE